MAISFNGVPNNIRVPFMTAEFDSTNAIRGAQYQPYKTLLLGQMLPTGTATPNVPVRVNNLNEANVFFGAGSMLASMTDYYRRSDNITEMWAVAIADDDAGAPASATIEVTGAASEPGSLYVYISGIRFTVPVKAGNDENTIAAAIVTAANAVSGLPVTVAATDKKVTFTALHAGEAGNNLDIRINYYDGEYTPAGVGLTITPFSGGVANPDVTDAISVVSGEWFNAFVCPYTDLNNLYVITEDLIRRWGPLVMQEGWLFASVRGTHGELGEFGNRRNSKHECIMHCHGLPNAPWEVAASVAANAMNYGNIDPARPFQTLPMVGIKPPRMEDRFPDFPENNQLLYDGISHYTVDDGVVRIGRLVTTYKTNERGADDTSYLDLNTGLTLAYIRWDWRNHMLRKFPRHKLANDGIRHGAGQAIVTPMIAKAECIVKARDWEERGLVENVDLFKKELVVERNASDPNRLDFLMRPDLVNQLIVGAAQIQFYL